MRARNRNQRDGEKDGEKIEFVRVLFVSPYIYCPDCVFRKRVSLTFGNPVTFNQHKRKREHLHPKL